MSTNDPHPRDERIVPDDVDLDIEFDEDDVTRRTIRFYGRTSGIADYISDSDSLPSTNQVMNDALNLAFSIVVGASTKSEYDTRLEEAESVLQRELGATTFEDEEEVEPAEDGDEGDNLPAVQDFRDAPEKLNELDYSTAPALPANLDYSATKQGIRNRGPVILGRLKQVQDEVFLDRDTVERVTQEVSNVNPETRETYIQELVERNVIIAAPWREDSKFRTEEIQRNVRQAAADAIGDYVRYEDEQTKNYAGAWEDAPTSLPALLARNWDNWQDSHIEYWVGDEIPDDGGPMECIRAAGQLAGKCPASSEDWPGKDTCDVSDYVDERSRLIPGRAEAAGWFKFTTEMIRTLKDEAGITKAEYDRLRSALQDIKNVVMDDATKKESKAAFGAWNRVTMSVNPEYTEYTATVEKSVEESEVESAVELLGLDEVPEDSTAVDEAFRERSKETHPDVDGGDEDTFRKVKDAHQTVLDAVEVDA